MRTRAERLDTATGTRVSFTPSEVLLRDGGLWPGVRVEQWRVVASELPETVLFQHGLLLNLSPKTAEVRWSGHRPISGTFAPGNVALLPAGLPYRADGRHSSVTLLIGLEPAYLERLLRPADVTAVELVPAYGVTDPFVEATCLALADDIRQDHPMGAMYGEALCAALALHLARTRSADPRLQVEQLHHDDFRMKQVKAYIADNIDTKLTLAALAAEVGLDVFAFSRWFRRQTGTTPHQFVLGQRIDLAKRLLSATKVELLDVAFQCGFSSHSHLTSAFRRFVGTTPSEFRRLLQSR